MKKVVFFIHDLHEGGAQRVIVNLVNGMSRKGIKTYLIYLHSGPMEVFVEPQAVMIKLAAKRVLTAIPEIIKKIIEIKPDVVYTGLLQNNIVLCVVSFLTRTKLVVSEHSIASKVSLDEENIFIKFGSKFRRVFYKFSYKIIAVSEACKSDLVSNFNIPPKSISVIYNPVIESINHYIRKNKNKDHIDICIIARLHPVKNHRLLIDAVSLLKKFKECKLHIIGDGYLKNEIEEYACETIGKDFFEMYGHVKNPFNLLNKMDVCVVSSSIEGFGNVVVEAISTGTPVVSTKCVGPEEILKDKPNLGFICEHDAENLASCILAASSLVIDEKQAHDFCKLFTVENIAERYINDIL